ncbi:MAG: pitrilysin family protein [Bacteroidota bacterium]
MKNIYPALFFVVAFLAPFSGLKADPTEVASVEGITEYHLTNGLKVLLFPDPSKQTITVNITYLVGSKHENYGETGMAHLLEHMVFKGTPGHPDIKAEITNRGNRWNGTTWYDRTNYFETVPASTENLEWALEMEADRMINSFISKEDLESEMTVVRNEFEAGENSPYNVLLQRMFSTAFLWHNYGKSTIGARSDIENAPIERLQAFYKQYYQPDNAVLIVTGKIDEDETLALVEKYFGVIPKPQRKLPEFYTIDPTQDGERSVSLRRIGNTQLTGVAYHVPSGVHEDFAGIDIINHVLSNDPSGRLYQSLIDTKMATRVIGFNNQLMDPGIAFFATEAMKEKDIHEIKDIMLSTIDDIGTNPPSEEEIERARNYYLRNIEQAFNTSEWICLMLSEWIGMGDWRMFFIHRDRLQTITQEEVEQVAQYYFKPSNRTVGIFEPIDKTDHVEIPETPDITDLVSNYKGKEAIAMGESFDPSVDNIENRTTRLELSNGMKLALLPKSTRGENIWISVTLLNGDENSLTGKREISQITANMLMRGTVNLNREEIQDKINELKSSLYVSGSRYYVTGSIETTRSNYKEVLTLLEDVLKNPSFPVEEFEKLKTEMITNIEYQRKEPGAIASMELSRHINPYPSDDVRYVPTFDESIQRIKDLSIEDLKDFHKSFYGASNATCAIVGDFDLEETSKLIDDLFVSWESPVSFSAVKNQLHDVELMNKNFETPEKANAFFFGRQQFKFDPEHKDHPSLVMGFYLLGEGFSSRLVKRIREQEGLSYGVGGSFEAHPIDKLATFNAYAIYAPENRDKLEEAFRDEIQKVVTEGFTDEEVAEGIKAWLEMRKVNQRAQDNFVVRRLSLYMEWGRDLFWDKKLEEDVSKLTAADVNKTMKKYLDLNKIHMSKAGDFAKSEQ